MISQQFKTLLIIGDSFNSNFTNGIWISYYPLRSKNIKHNWVNLEFLVSGLCCTRLLRIPTVVFPQKNPPGNPMWKLSSTGDATAAVKSRRSASAGTERSEKSFFFGRNFRRRRGEVNGHEVTQHVCVCGKNLYGLNVVKIVKLTMGSLWKMHKFF